MSNKKTIDDQKLWVQATSDVTKLQTKARILLSPPEMRVDVLPRPVSDYHYVPASAMEPLHMASNANIDAQTRRRVDQGKYPIDATLDLHGYNHQQARHSLEAFLLEAYRCQYRLLLVITGKGRNSANESNKLKDMLLAWINHSVLMRKVVLRVSPAHQKHGGSGAFYILLKRHKV